MKTIYFILIVGLFTRFIASGEVYFIDYIPVQYMYSGGGNATIYFKNFNSHSEDFKVTSSNLGNNPDLKVTIIDHELSKITGKITSIPPRTATLTISWKLRIRKTCYGYYDEYECEQLITRSSSFEIIVLPSMEFNRPVSKLVCLNKGEEKSIDLSNYVKNIPSEYENLVKFYSYKSNEGYDPYNPIYNSVLKITDEMTMKNSSDSYFISARFPYANSFYAENKYDYKVNLNPKISETNAISGNNSALSIIDCINSEVTLNVEVPGLSNSYQWKRIIPNITSDVAEATSSSYSFSLNETNVGEYYCTVTNTCGSNDSKNLSIQMHNNDLRIKEEFEPKSVCEGDNISFTVKAEGGYGTLIYRWSISTKTGTTYQEKTNHTGTSNNYTKSKVTKEKDHNTYFRVRVSDACSSKSGKYAYSSYENGKVEVYGKPTITSQPPITSETVCIGSKLKYTIQASGGGTISYSWTKDGSSDIISDTISHTNELVLNPIISGGSYTSVVSDDCGKITGNTVTVNVYDKVKVNSVKVFDSSNKEITQNISGPYCPNTGLSITVDATAGSGALTYDWLYGSSNFYNDIPFSSNWFATYTGTKSNRLVINGIPSIRDDSDYKTGKYFKVKVGDACSSISGYEYSAPVTLKAVSPPKITKQPEDKLVCKNSSVELVVWATSDNRRTYQWEKKMEGGAFVAISSLATKNNYSGITSYTLKIENVTEKSTVYRVKVTNDCQPPQSVYSNEITVSTYNQINIIGHPQDITACRGSNPSFEVTANGGFGDLIYRWETSSDQNTWERILGTEVYEVNSVITRKLNLISVSEGLDGHYFRAKVSDDCSSVYSEPAQLTLIKTPKITSQPDSKVFACEKGNIELSIDATIASDVQHNLNYRWESFSRDNQFNTINNVSNKLLANRYSGSRSSVLRIDSVTQELQVRIKTWVGGCELFTYSSLIKVSLYPDLELTKGLDAVSICPNQGASFKVEAESPIGDLAYNWEISDNAEEVEVWIPIETSSIYTNTNTNIIYLNGVPSEEDSKKIRVTVTDGCSIYNASSVESIAMLSVGQPPKAEHLSEDIQICQGGDVLFAGKHLGGTSLVWQYSHDLNGNSAFASLDKYIDIDLSLTDVGSEDTGLYRFHVTNDCNLSATSESIKLEVFESSIISIGEDIELCKDASILNLELDKSLDVNGKFTWIQNGFTIANTIFNPQLHESEEYVITFTPNDKSPSNCFIDSSRKITVKSEGGKGSLTFLVGDTNTTNLCVGDEPIILSEYPNLKGGNWTSIKGSGLSTSLGKTIFTPSQNQYTETNPNIYRYNHKENGCSVHLDLNIYVKDNKNIIEIPTLRSVCPETEITLTPNSSLVGQESYNFYNYDNDSLISSGQTLNYLVNDNTQIKISSVNNFGCESKAKAIKLVTVFGNADINIQPHTASIGELVNFGYDLDEAKDVTFIWNFDEDFEEPSLIANQYTGFYFYVPKTYNIKLELNSALGCSKQLSKELVITGELYDPFSASTMITEIESKEENVITIWPSPVSNILNLKGGVNMVLIRNLFGQKLVEVKEEDISIVDLSSLVSGNYTIELENEQTRVIKKLIKH